MKFKIIMFKTLKYYKYPIPGLIEAKKKMERCSIIKFHGHPKPNEVIRPWRHPAHTILRAPLKPRTWWYMKEEIQNHWH
jgi:hypothetical protein